MGGLPINWPHLHVNVIIRLCSLFAFKPSWPLFSFCTRLHRLSTAREADALAVLYRLAVL